MFGLTKREQRWAVQERDIKLILDAKRIADLEEQNKVMREALEKLRDCDFAISLPDRMDSVRDIARLALDKEG